MLTSALWLRKNMLGYYSDDPEKSLSDAKERVQRCIEQLEVPDWYQQRSKPPPKILRNAVPIECRPATWKTYRIKRKTPRKTPRRDIPKKNTPNMDLARKDLPRQPRTPSPPATHSPVSLHTHSPKDARPETPRTASVDSGFCETYCIRRKSFRRPRIPFKPISSSSSSDEDYKLTEATDLKAPALKSTLDKSLERWSKSARLSLNTYPRVSPSRKIQNINIVFPKPFPPCESDILDISNTPRIIDTLKKKPIDSPSEDERNSDVEPTLKETSQREESHNSTYPVEEDEPSRPRSPGTKLFESGSKSKQSPAERSYVQSIIQELDRSVAERSFASSSTLAQNETITRSFVKSMVEALERSFQQESEDDRQSVDSELCRSASISIGSSDEERSTTPAPSVPFEDLHEDVYWIPSKLRQLPRTSSRLSILSNRSSIFDGLSRSQSPGLSPIKRDKRQSQQQQQQQRNAWGRTYRTKGVRLFSIDETGPPDSGYSDKSAVATGMATWTWKGGERRGKLPKEWTSETLVESCESLSISGPYVLKSFYV